MTNKRRMYYRKKGKTVILEGKRKRKTIYLFTLPNPDNLLEILRSHFENLGKPNYPSKLSFLTKEKFALIIEKVGRLDYKNSRESKGD